MRASGLELTLEFIQKLLPIKGTLSKSSLRGLNKFNSFSWKGFRKVEFINQLKIFDWFNSKKCLKVDNNQLFIFNYMITDMELDITTILLDKNNSPCLIDIEIKNGRSTDLKEQLHKQVINRPKTNLFSLLKNNSYIVVGFLNGQFQEAIKNNKSKISTLNESSFVNEIASLKSFKDVRTDLDEIYQYKSLSDICNQIKDGSFPLDSYINSMYEDIKKSQENVIIAYGNAGSGKTTLALKLFFSMKNAKALFLNTKLYFVLSLGKYFYENKSSFNHKGFMKIIDKDTIAIVDEAQCISPIEIKQIIAKAKKVILFGDSKQAYLPSGTLLTKEKLSTEIKTLSPKINVKIINFKENRRFSERNAICLSSLTDISLRKRKKINENYKINIFNNEIDFINEYKNARGAKKIYVPMNGPSYNSEIIIAGNKFNIADWYNNAFSVISYADNLIGKTCHALSFEVDHSFVYLKKAKQMKDGRKNVICWDKNLLLKANKHYQTAYENELNILFTRGRKSLNVFIDDPELYLTINKIVNKMKNKSK